MTRTGLAAGLLGLAAFGGITGWWMLSSSGATYKVQSGDTLWGIARDHGVTVADLRAWNGISGDRLEVGDRLRLAADGEMPAVKTPRKTASGKRRTRKRPARETVRAPAVSGSSGPPALQMPSPEPCVPFTADPGEEGMVAPEGLSLAQARGALNPVLQMALSCIPDPDVDRVDMVFEIVVGCDGVVDRVEVLERGQGTDRYAGCVAGVLGHADFPAHDLPDGDVITYPVTVEW